MKFERIFCFGDSITLGANDGAGLGWPGRLCRGLVCGGFPVATYNLGVNGDTSRDIAMRWRAETDARSRNGRGLLIFAFGFNDAARADGDLPQVDLASSLANARTLLGAARTLSTVLWIGPAPLDESVNPMPSRGVVWTMYNAEIAAYDEAYAELARQIGIDYLPLYPRLAGDARYLRALRDGDRVHPADDGYAVIAEAIAAWPAWRALQEPAAAD